MAKKKISKKQPTVVKIIAVLTYVISALLLISSIFLFIGAGLADEIINSSPLLASIGSAAFVIFGIVLLAFAVLGYFIGRGLWKGEQWARVLVIIFSALGFLGGLSSIFKGRVFGGILDLVIYAVIGGYLWFNKEVNKAFA